VGSKVDRAGSDPLDRIDRVDHYQDGEPGGVFRERHPAANSPPGGNDPRLDQGAQYLGEVRRRDLRCLGDRGGGSRAILFTGEVNHGPQGVFDGL
jgi:hypothetical protein